ncbi:MAG: cytochrome, partial [Acidimicrobiia bacterium]|nr:cytochrome [Acidimicrobiia bacterium]
MTVYEQQSLDVVADELAAFLTDPSKFPDPYPMFRRLRELEPVHWSRWNTWVVTGYPEAESILLNPAIAREASAQQQFRPLGMAGIDAADIVEAVDIQLASVLNRDPPAHTRLRKLVSRAFTPRAVASWEPRIAAIVDNLIDSVEGQDEFDLLHELAYPLPQTVICELFNIPFDDLAAITPTGFSHSRVMTARGANVAPPPEELRTLTQQQLVRQVAYFRDVVADRRRHPGDDLISTLVLAEEEGDRLSMDELIGTVIILVGAGYETTANLVGNGTLALLRHPDQFALLKEDPSIVPFALEEILRHDSPSRGQPRIAEGRIEIAGKVIEPGDQVSVILNAANRDPRVFEDPDRFDVTRRNIRHITFTAGIHYCLGASLAKAEAAMMFRAIATRLG